MDIQQTLKKNQEELLNKMNGSDSKEKENTWELWIILISSAYNWSIRSSS